MRTARANGAGLVELLARDADARRRDGPQRSRQPFNARLDDGLHAVLRRGFRRGVCRLGRAASPALRGRQDPRGRRRVVARVLRARRRDGHCRRRGQRRRPRGGAWWRGWRARFAAANCRSARAPVRVHAYARPRTPCSTLRDRSAQYLHVDWWAQQVPKGAKARGLPDSGFFEGGSRVFGTSVPVLARYF